MYEQNTNRTPRPVSNTLSTLSLVCAIIGIVSSCCLYAAFVFGGLAIVFGLLSRGSAKRPSGQAKVAVRIGILAVVLSCVITIGSFVSAIRKAGSFQNLIDTYTQTIEKILGTDPLDSEPDLDSGSGNYL